MPDLIVIAPGGASGTYQKLSDRFTAIEPNLWVRLIAGYVRDLGSSVEIIDAAAEDLSPDQVAERAIKDEPTLVCVVAEGHQPSASAQSMQAVQAICEAIKLREPYTPIVVTGGYPSALPNETMAEVQTDYVCVGEGPVTVFGLVRARGSDGRWRDDVPGLVWRQGNIIMRNPPAPLLDVKTLHGDVWDLLPMDLYRSHNWQVFDDPTRRQPYASIYTSLGCPYKCVFCCINAPFGGNGYRMRRPDNVVSEVSRLYASFGVTTFKIIDEMFVLNDRHVTEICEGLTALDFSEELNIWAYARIDSIKSEQLPLLRRAGIRWLALGIESGNASVRDGSNKTMDVRDIGQTVKAIQAAGINVIGNFIFGLPDDTMESMCETLGLAKALNCEFSNFYSAMAYPGSALYTATPESDLPESWSGYSQHSYDCQPLPTATLSAKEVLEFRDYAFHEYYSGDSYLNSIEKKFGWEVRRHITAMSEHRLERKLLDG